MSRIPLSGTVQLIAALRVAVLGHGNGPVGTAIGITSVRSDVEEALRVGRGLPNAEALSCPRATEWTAEEETDAEAYAPGIWRFRRDWWRIRAGRV